MQKLQTFLFSLFLIVTLHTFAQGGSDNLKMYVGTYTEGGNSKGIYTYNFNQVTGSFELLNTVSAGNPSFVTLSPDGKRLYAVSEYNDRRQGAYSFDLDNDNLPLGNSVFQSAQVGADPCHIYTDGKNVITANYTGGDVTVFPLDRNGRLAPASQHIAFAGKTPERMAHIHCIVPSPDKRYIFITDLGNDNLYRFRYHRNPKNGEVLSDKVVAYEASDGQGPRHFTFSKDGRFAYLINELGGECVVLSYRNGKMKEVQRLMADEGGGRGSADIHISPDGRFLYTSHRLKKDGIAIFTIDPKKGTLTKVGYQLTGIHPRNFAITPNGEYLLVACRDDNNIRIFKRDMATGTLTDTSISIAIDKPTCIIFAE